MIGDEAVLILAERLYEKWTQLDPDPDDVEWKELSERQKRFYELLVESILEQRELVSEAMSAF